MTPIALKLQEKQAFLSVLLSMDLFSVLDMSQIRA